MSEDQSGIIRILEKTLKGADKDRKRILAELAKIQKNSDELRKIIYRPYHGLPGEKIPVEFSDPLRFGTLWDNTDRALGNTILMVMPPSIFQASFQEFQTEKVKEKTQPIIIAPAASSKSETPARMPVRGFFSGFWDLRIAKLANQPRKTEQPTITTEKVTYDPQDVIYQLIPSLNKLKDLYSDYLDRHNTYPRDKPSLKLLQHGHNRMRREMTKYFNVVNPFSYASIVFQTEKVRRDKLLQARHLGRIAEAEAMRPVFPTYERSISRRQTTLYRDFWPWPR